MFTRVITNTKKNDYKLYTQRVALNWSDTLPISANQCYYDETLNVLKCNCNRGYLRHWLGKVSVGDVINIKADVFAESGMKPHISLDYSNVEHGGKEIGTSGIDNTPSLIGTWETIDMTFIAQYDCDYLTSVIGLAEGEVGVFQIGRIAITVKSIHNEKNNRIARVLKKGSEWSIYEENGSDNDLGIIEVIDDNTVKIKFKGFTRKVTPLAFVDQIVNGSRGVVTEVTSTPKDTTVSINFYDASGTKLALSALGSWFTFSVFMFV